MPHPAAPVLVLPRVFEREFCAQVMRLWEKGDHRDSGVSSRYGNVGMLGAEAHRGLHGHRADDAEGDLRSPRLPHRAGAGEGLRLRPRVHLRRPRRAVLQRRGRHFFGAHRDNGAPTTADRSFAVSLNLNDDFEGGELVFPEYSGVKVSPPAGGAAVFSCSVLHEALPVTRGRRFVLTTFFRTKK